MNFIFRSKKLYGCIILCMLSWGCGNDLNVSPLEWTGVNIPYDDSNADMYLNVVVTAMKCSKNKVENINNVISMIETIMAEKSDTRLIVFGETVFGWYYKKNKPEAYQRAIAGQIPGTETTVISNLCILHDIFIVFGMTELRDDRLYNSQVLINPDGEIADVHNKVNLIDLDIKSGFDSKKNFQIVDIDGVKAGMSICADANSKWLVHKYIDHEIDILLSSDSTPEKTFNYDYQSRRMNAWICLANHCGKEDEINYAGLILISDPAGNIRVGGTGKQRYEYYKIGIKK